MQVILRKITNKNQISLPIKLLEELEIKPMANLLIVKKGEAILLKKTARIDDLYGLFKQKRKYSLKELEKIAKKAIIARALKKNA